ncbi:hypothetical protein [Haloimpatiens lingqiaonensis]|uniref:hypothetical protein n=1 Tax=Haloimpatiens lingqiaonensis TaxID=1380675 RepID=UPI0010FDFCEF|nr:hypothetical protein [Haloimpatiens lingqiaonensis]
MEGLSSNNSICKDKNHKNYKRRKRKVRKVKYRLIFLTLLVVVPLIIFSRNLMNYNKNYNYHLGEKIYKSMSDEQNRKKAYVSAIYLNGGYSENTCVLFLSEVLRMNGEKIDVKVCNTNRLLDIMKADGWKIERDYKKLKPGDICFTTDESLNKKGIPSHTYIFMGWQKEGSYDYAYICDNQAKDYQGKIYHLRNIAKVDKIGKSSKEPFSFFMYKR